MGRPLPGAAVERDGVTVLVRPATMAALVIGAGPAVLALLRRSRVVA